jgi:MFS family permease
MAALHPAPGAEDIDEHAARRSIRVTLIVLIAVFLFSGLLGVVVGFRLVDHRPVGVHHSVPAWALVLIVGFPVICLAATAWWVRRQYRRPVYRRVMQYGWRRRRRVVKDLRRGRPLCAEDQSVAAALVNLLRSQHRWVVILYGLLPVIWLFNGLIQHGFLRWFDLGLAAYCLVLGVFLRRQRRQLIVNYERQYTPNLR